jgi:hypothetical protein
MNHLSELRPENAAKWCIQLELDRLAWRSKHFDDAINAALARDDAGFREAMNEFWQSTRDSGLANNQPERD